MKFLRRLVLHNLGLKLLALVIALLLWSTYTAQPTVEIGYTAPIELRNLSERLEVSTDMATQVHVRLRGRSALLRHLTPADLTVSLDLSGRGEGETLFRLNADQLKLPPGVELVRIAPAELRVRLVPRPPAR